MKCSPYLTQLQKVHPFAPFVCAASQGDLWEAILSESAVRCIGEINEALGFGMGSTPQDPMDSHY